MTTAKQGPPASALECAFCKGRHPDFRSVKGHLELDPKTGATVLVPHGRSLR